MKTSTLHHTKRTSTQLTPARLVLAALPLALLAACAHETLPADSLQSNATVTQQWDATSPDTHTVMASPARGAPTELTADMADADYDAQQQTVSDVTNDPVTDTNAIDNKEDAMTVLVIESPEQLAKLAEQQAAANLLTVANATMEAETAIPRPTQRIFHYGFNKAQLPEEDTLIIEQHASYLKENPDLKIRVNGHTDAQGNDNYNQSLSEKRAAKVAEQLQKMGIEKSRIEIVGWGSHAPMINPANPKENRRIELEYVESQFASNH